MRMKGRVALVTGAANGRPEQSFAGQERSWVVFAAWEVLAMRQPSSPLLTFIECTPMAILIQ